MSGLTGTFAHLLEGAQAHAGPSNCQPGLYLDSVQVDDPTSLPELYCEGVHNGLSMGSAVGRGARRGVQGRQLASVVPLHAWDERAGNCLHGEVGSDVGDL